MSTSTSYDAIIIGSGPNGLAAAITLAQAGARVMVIEAKPTIGGGMRTLELTLPNFKHDICSAIHPLGLASPFFRQLPLEQQGLSWIQPDLPLAHPFDDGTAVAMHIDIDQTAAGLGRDGRAYSRMMRFATQHWEKILDQFLGPLALPKHPLTIGRFAAQAGQPASLLANLAFCEEKTRGYFAGIAAHSILPLYKLGSAAFGLMLGMLGHAVGWPIPKGGSQSIANSMAAYLKSLGGEITTDWHVKSLAELPSAQVILFDTTPRQLVQIAGDELPNLYQRRLQTYRYGPGVCKVDWALSEPIPWQAEACRKAGTIHLGGTLPEIAQSEREMWHGRHSNNPYVLVAQQSLFDPTRAPDEQHTAWAYCHVPHGSTRDVTDIIENQMERFAPGFKDCIIGKKSHTAVMMSQYNPNYIGGDIIGGVQDIRQLFTRPVTRLVPYSTPNQKIFLCSSSTPPGGGVHGMCGYHAAQAALKVM